MFNNNNPHTSSSGTTVNIGYMSIKDQRSYTQQTMNQQQQIIGLQGGGDRAKVCSRCNRLLPFGRFSVNQLKKSDHVRRCDNCIGC